MANKKGWRIPKDLFQVWDLIVFTFYWFYSPYEASLWIDKKWNKQKPKD